MSTTLTQWPAEFLSDARRMGAGRVIGCEPEALVRATCSNCGGFEQLFAFYTDSGPHQTVPSSDGRRSMRYVPELGGWFTGELKAAPCPICAGTGRTRWLERSSGLADLDLTIRLDDFKPLPGKAEARAVAAQLLALAPYPSGFVTFHGDYGRGKTLLLKALVNGFRVANLLAVYTNMADLLAEVRDKFGDANAQNAASSLLAEYRKVRVLVLDEIDRVNLTPWAAETMFRLLDGRYSASEECLTIMGTNHDPADLGIGDYAYLASRMTSGVVIKVGGDDMRPVQGVRARAELEENYLHR